MKKNSGLKLVALSGVIMAGLVFTGVSSNAAIKFNTSSIKNGLRKAVTGFFTNKSFSILGGNMNVNNQSKKTNVVAIPEETVYADVSAFRKSPIKNGEVIYANLDLPQSTGKIHGKGNETVYATIIKNNGADDSVVYADLDLKQSSGKIHGAGNETIYATILRK